MKYVWGTSLEVSSQSRSIPDGPHLPLLRSPSLFRGRLNSHIILITVAAVEVLSGKIKEHYQYLKCVLRYYETVEYVGTLLGLRDGSS